MTSNEITEALKSVDYAIRLNAIRQPNATPEHITKALCDTDFNVRFLAINHTNATARHIIKAMNDYDFSIRYSARVIFCERLPLIVMDLPDKDKYMSHVLKTLIGVKNDSYH